MSRATLFSLVMPAAASPAPPLTLTRVSQAPHQHLCAVCCAGTRFVLNNSQPAAVPLPC